MGSMKSWSMAMTATSVERTSSIKVAFFDSKNYEFHLDYFQGKVTPACNNNRIITRERTNVEEKSGSIDTANTARRGQSQPNKKSTLGYTITKRSFV